jgi:hypothetical protein
LKGRQRTVVAVQNGKQINKRAMDTTNSVLIQLGCFGTVPRVREPGAGGVVLRQSGEAGDNVGLRPIALKAEQFEPQAVHDKVIARR